MLTNLKIAEFNFPKINLHNASLRQFFEALGKSEVYDFFSTSKKTNKH